MKELLKKLTGAFGPSGREDGIREVIRREVEPFVDRVEVDAMGSLIAIKEGPGKCVMLAAHMDQIGFIVADSDKEGFLRVHQVGGLNRDRLLTHKVVFENGVVGVFSEEERDNDPPDRTLGHLYIDIGAASREEALKHVPIGTMGTVEPQWGEMLNDRVCATATDDRAGCAMAIMALKRMKACPNKVAAVFTVQEEVGLRGARTAAYRLDPHLGLALDVTPAGDTPKGDRLPVKLGSGVAIKVMDRSVICAPQVVASLEEAAKENNIPFQREVLDFGGTDAGAIHLSRSGVPSGALSIPCRYTHTACEVVDINDMEAGADLLARWLEKAL